MLLLIGLSVVVYFSFVLFFKLVLLVFFPDTFYKYLFNLCFIIYVNRKEIKDKNLCFCKKASNIDMRDLICHKLKN